MTQSISATGTQTTTTSTVKKNTVVGKDDFLKLLTYQLKSQDPTKPYDNQQFAAQLAQFSQLEQLTSIKSLLEDSVKSNNALTQTMANSALPGMLGKQAKASGASFNYENGGSTKLGYTSSTASSAGELTVLNESGRTIRTIKLSGADLTAGEHKMDWDGKDSDGNQAATGKYSVKVNLTAANGTTAAAQTYVYGKVEAVRFKSEGTMLVINGTETSLANVVDITN